MKRSFRERDPLRMGVLGMATVALLVLLSFNLTRFETGTRYSAAFTEASGLKSSEDVRVAGVKVGKVKKVSLEGDHVKVVFTVDGKVRFGASSRAQIKIATLLGAHYLELQPSGGPRQSPHSEIPTSRTTPAYDVVPALQDLSGQLQKIDIPQLGKAFDTLSDTLQGSSANVRGTLDGLRKVSRAIASRDDELSRLLTHSRNVTKLLADRSGDLAALVSDGSKLLQEVDDRRAVVRSLLSGTVTLSQQITGTVEENRATLNPALTQLHKVVGILLRNQDNLTRAVHTLGPFVTTAADATSTGRFFDGYLQNLIPLPVSVAPPASTPPAGGKPTPAATPGGDTLPIFH
ncbi:MCE family protein [Actinomadura sp. DC4]|uniref:MCE family protein n=1 Tax=Actinomadura sp. DC4 TaxID=3055069 RepID=UPI0025B1D8BC|nr:MCE family protein [Actinomadura sp. DC4]MDN3359536.1 MCE family protein [Actinomadura sp. DC4]